MNSSDNSYRILFYDIETAPMLIWAWGIWEQNAIAVEKQWYIMSISYKWEGDRKPTTIALPDFELYKKDPENDRELAKKLHELFSEADLIVAHNGDKFDQKKTNTRLIYHGFTPPSPYKTIDTLKLARKYFAFTSNRLGDLAEFLGIGKKLDTGGFGLWRDCIKYNLKAWTKMKKYNAQDVVLLEGVYNRLRSWHSTHPNITITTGESLLCPVCGGPTTQKHWNNLKSYRTRRYLCLNEKCGKWSSGKRQKLTQELLA